MDTVRMLGSHYRLGELIGRGAMGEVHVAVDTETNERLAAKILRSEHNDDDEVTARFLQERRLLRELDHPNIVRVRELVVDRDVIAIVMDLVEGQDLRKLLRAVGTLPPAEAVRIAVDVLSALQLAHSLTPAVQHRDVKPDNVLLGAGDPAQVFLTDFGVARLAEVGTSVRLTSGVGTADYMAPEMTGRTAGAPADVYAVGVMLYELLCGHTPFGGDSFQAVALRHVTSQVPVLDAVPPALWENLTSLLVKSPESRPDAATASARLRALLPDLTGLPALPRTPAPQEWTPIGAFSVAASSALPAPDLADLDELDKGTQLRGAARAATPELPVAAGPTAFVGRPDALSRDDVEQATNLVDRAARQRDLDAATPAIATAVVATPTKSRSRTVLIAVGVVAAAAAVTVGVVAVASNDSGGTRSGGAAPQGAASAALPVEGNSPAGALPFEIDRAATYDAAAKTLTVKVTLDNRGAGLMKGPFLEVVPATTADGSCPAAPWTSASDVQATQVGSGCAWSLALDAGLGAGKQATTSYTIPFTPDGDAQAAVTSYLNSVRDTLTSSLGAFGPGSTDFMTQRLTGISAALDGSSARVGVDVPLSVYPLLSSGSDSVPNRNAALMVDGQPTDTFDNVGLKDHHVTAEGNSSCIFDERTNSFHLAGTQCSLTVQLGDQLTASTGTFSVGQ